MEAEAGAGWLGRGDPLQVGQGPARWRSAVFDRQMDTSGSNATRRQVGRHHQSRDSQLHRRTRFRAPFSKPRVWRVHVFTVSRNRHPRVEKAERGPVEHKLVSALFTAAEGPDADVF